MKAILFAVFAMMLWAVENVIIERRLAKISPLVNFAFFYIGTSALVLMLVLFRQQLGMKLVMPEANQFWMIVVCSLILLVANFCLFSAYYSGGSVFTVTVISILFPVFAMLIKFAFSGGWPSSWQILGWVFAAAAVILVSK